MTFTIGNVAKRSGLSRDTLRYYETLELIPKPGRRYNNYRIYPDDILSQLHFIQHAKQIGFTLTDIRQLLTLRQPSATVCTTVKHKISDKLKDIENKIKALNSIHQELRVLLRVCETTEDLSTCHALDTLTGTERPCS